MPAAATEPSISPPWKCGTRPQAARSRVDLPQAERPARRTNSPGPTSSETPSRARPADARIGVGEALDREGRSDPPRRGELSHGAGRGRRGRRAARGRGSRGRRRPRSPGRRRSRRRRATAKPAARTSRARADRVEAGVEAGARPPLPRPRGAERVAAQLDRRGDVDGAVERAGEQAAGQRRPADRGGAGAAQAGRVAQPGGVGGGDRDQPRDQGRGQRRAPGERPQRAQHPVRVDAGGVDGEGDHHDGGAQAEHRAFGDRLGGHVDPAEQRPLAEPRQHGLRRG